MRLYILSTCLLCMLVSSLQAQELLAVAGNYHSSNQGSLSWTIGEIITETESNQEAILSQGFQQTTITITGLELLNREQTSWLVYPNPVINQLIIHSEGDESIDDAKALIFDLRGKCVVNQDLFLGHAVIDFTALVSGTYLLKIIDGGNSHLYSFSIVKQ